MFHLFLVGPWHEINLKTLLSLPKREFFLVSFI